MISRFSVGALFTTKYIIEMSLLELGNVQEMSVYFFFISMGHIDSHLCSGHLEDYMQTWRSDKCELKWRRDLSITFDLSMTCDLCTSNSVLLVAVI